MSGDAPSYDDLARKVSELTDRLDSIERSRPSPTQPMTRRAMMRSAAAASVGVAAGAMLAGAPAAHAALNDPVLQGNDNNAGNSATVLRSNTSGTVYTVVA